MPTLFPALFLLLVTASATSPPLPTPSTVLRSTLERAFTASLPNPHADAASAAAELAAFLSPLIDAHNSLRRVAGGRQLLHHSVQSTRKDEFLLDVLADLANGPTSLQTIAARSLLSAVDGLNSTTSSSPIHFVPTRAIAATAKHLSSTRRRILQKAHVFHSVLRLACFSSIRVRILNKARDLHCVLRRRLRMGASHASRICSNSIRSLAVAFKEAVATIRSIVTETVSNTCSVVMQIFADIGVVGVMAKETMWRAYISFIYNWTDHQGTPWWAMWDPILSNISAAFDALNTTWRAWVARPFIYALVALLASTSATLRVFRHARAMRIVHLLLSGTVVFALMTAFKIWCGWRCVAGSAVHTAVVFELLFLASLIKTVLNRAVARYIAHNVELRRRGPRPSDITIVPKTGVSPVAVDHTGRALRPEVNTRMTAARMSQETGPRRTAVEETISGRRPFRMVYENSAVPAVGVDEMRRMTRSLRPRRVSARKGVAQMRADRANRTMGLDSENSSVSWRPSRASSTSTSASASASAAKGEGIGRLSRSGPRPLSKPRSSARRASEDIETIEIED